MGGQPFAPAGRWLIPAVIGFQPCQLVPGVDLEAIHTERCALSSSELEACELIFYLAKAVLTCSFLYMGSLPFSFNTAKRSGTLKKMTNPVSK